MSDLRLFQVTREWATPESKKKDVEVIEGSETRYVFAETASRALEILSEKTGNDWRFAYVDAQFPVIEGLVGI